VLPARKVPDVLEELPPSSGLKSKQCNQVVNTLNVVYAKQYIPCWGL
jgi:hypothetical protein